jgi:hypothetical protein
MLKRADWQALQSKEGATPVQLEFSFVPLDHAHRSCDRKECCHAKTNFLERLMP